jgi:hypothetical protein
VIQLGFPFAIIVVGAVVIGAIVKKLGKVGMIYGFIVGHDEDVVLKEV